ncbi:MAG: hypothetical protein HC871_03425 [Rhizobiales bacterium]|nr:hypothetical protein [Hyphomicrobiales bacterium]
MDQAIGNTIGHFGRAPDAVAEQAEAGGRQTVGSANGERSMDRHVYAGREWSSDHPLNIRVSVPLGIGRYYITLVAGKERRARARLALDRRENPLDTPGNVLFLALIAAIATSGSITLLYLLLAHIFGWSGRLLL